MHDETYKQIIICNDDCKFATYVHSILQEFSVKNMVKIMIHSKRFPLETVSQLRAWCTCPIRVLRRITFIVDELDFPWDTDISSIFSEADSTLSAACAFLDLSSTAAALLRRPVPTAAPWFRLDARPTILRPPPWPDWDASCGGAHTWQDRVFFTRKMMRTSLRLLIYYYV